MMAPKTAGRKPEAPKVWVSRAMMDSGLIKMVTSDLNAEDPQNALDTMQRNVKGEPLEAVRFPTEFYVDLKGKKYSKLPDIFVADGFWVVSSACAEVLGEFDLGEGALYPTKFFQYDRETPIEGEYFCLNFGAVKQCFVPEYSPGARRPYPKQDVWRQALVPEDDDIAVTRAALDGPDLWIDPDLWDAFFLSGPLVQALKTAKLTRRFGLRSCRVIREI